MLEPILTTHDQDCGIAQAGEITRQMTDIRTATVSIKGEISKVVETVFDVPMILDQAGNLPGIGLGRRKQRQAQDVLG